MFRADLKDKLENIFGYRKTTFLAPSDQFEQDTLFIQIDEAHPKVTEERATAKVMGTLTVFAQAQKFPFGSLSKKIEEASANLTAPFFFFDIETDVANSPARLVNIVERRTRFIFLYSETYDRSFGELTSVDFEETA